MLNPDKPKASCSIYIPKLFTLVIDNLSPPWKEVSSLHNGVQIFLSSIAKFTLERLPALVNTEDIVILVLRHILSGGGGGHFTRLVKLYHIKSFPRKMALSRLESPHLLQFDIKDECTVGRNAASSGFAIAVMEKRGRNNDHKFFNLLVILCEWNDDGASR